MTARRAAFWILVAAKLIGAWGLTWDILWHVRIGRDSFWIAPHVMIYASVAVAFTVSFAVVAHDTLTRARPGAATWRFGGLRGTPGFQLAAWGMAAVVLAAPVDDLWHRLFGLDVTLWSPPHLLGLGGSALNTLGCVVIAREVYPVGRVRRAGVLVAGALLYAGVRVVLDPAYLLAYAHGGVLFHAFAILAALALPVPLVVATRLADWRAAPVAVLVLTILIGLGGETVAGIGFAILQPVSVLEEEIRKDPASPIAQSQAIAGKNRTPPPFWARLIPLVAAGAMAIVDVRRRALAAGLGFAGVLFALSGWYLTLRPAFQPMVPGPLETVIAFGLTIVAAVIGTWAGRALADRLEGQPLTAPAATFARSAV